MRTGSDIDLHRTERARRCSGRILACARLGVLLLFLASFVQHSCVTSYLVSGNSMLPSYVDGDRVVVSRMPYVLGQPERGDTVVVMDGEILGKPAGAEDATRMLRQLRGRSHSVVSGVTALDGASGRWLASARESRVTMREYSDQELAAYVASGGPFDKAGAYAVQDVDFHPASHVEGCYLNVVGLPLCEVATLLARLPTQARLRSDWTPPTQCVDCPLSQRTEVVSP